MDEPNFWLSRDEVRELDRRAIEDHEIPGIVLMENAGRGCAELLMRLSPDRKAVIVLCGPGNNGGDGFVITRHLDNHEWPVFAFLYAPLDKLAPDASVNVRPLLHAGTLIVDRKPTDQDIGFANDWCNRHFGGAWIVDALFGTGLTRPLGPPYDELVAQVNASGNPVLAVDVPSGLDCDTGEPLGPTIRATHTATFVAPKKGFLNPRSREWTGEVHVIDIGAPRKLVDEFRALRQA
jgi:NAD(P)H-hydrate epimerase